DSCGRLSGRANRACEAHKPPLPRGVLNHLEETIASIVVWTYRIDISMSGLIGVLSLDSPQFISHHFHRIESSVHVRQRAKQRTLRIPQVIDCRARVLFRIEKLFWIERAPIVVMQRQLLLGSIDHFNDAGEEFFGIAISPTHGT